jgi:hypothetical protein
LQEEQLQNAKTFASFWSYYLSQHSQPATRTLHIAGTSIAALATAGWAITHRKSFLALALLGSYGPAWVGHGVIEKNRPATFEYPVWSLRADALMFELWLKGELDEEINRVAARPDSPPALRHA